MAQDPWKAHSMTVVYAGEPFPTTVEKALFLAGPTPRGPETKSWRPEALRVLEEIGYDGHVFIPENRDEGPYDFLGQVEWEYEGLNRADSIVFWVPRDMKSMPALTTNIEWGLWCDTGKAAFGAPTTAENVRYMKWQCDKLKVPMFTDLKGLLEHTVRHLGAGALRTGGETKVPLHVWKHPTFQGWYKAKITAGNRLDDLRVLWTFRHGKNRERVFAWAAQVSIWVAAEARHTSNEFVLGRSDLACVVLHCGQGFGADIVLIRESRNAARTAGGIITEIPGGSLDGDHAAEAARREVQEETGFAIEPQRLRLVDTRQLAGTMLAHTATVYAAEITEGELAEFKAQAGKVYGIEENDERTMVIVASFREILDGDYDIDWSTVGMIASALL